MPYDRADRIRRAAILVASLDEALAEQLLAELPHGEAERILSAAERLEPIDVEEQQDVLAEFRRLRRAAPAKESAVEFSYSASVESGDDAKTGPSLVALEREGYGTNGAAMSDGDAAAMAELLSAEHPQIVAAALARLGEGESAAVFAALPAEVQADALARLGDLAPADEGAVQEVESQLQRRLRERRDHQERAAAGAELVRKMLAHTPPAQRKYLLERIAAKNDVGRSPTVSQAPRDRAVSRAASPRRLDPAPQQALHLASAVQQMHAAEIHGVERLEDRSEDLASLSDEALVAGLRAADESTVLRALAASGEAFLARVTNMLPRRQAKQLRRMLRDLGPTRLADLHQAQHELLRLAHEAWSLEAA